jgi:hypothetical protein
MSGESSRATPDVTLTGAQQLELKNIMMANTEVMNEAQLMSHIRDINTGLKALAQLLTTNGLYKLQTEQQYVKNVHAQISELLAEGIRLSRNGTT